ncbi:MAG TPA: nuclear transport factor 2 family protein [Gemmatimonadales bacterium]|nr:nuclear transport factor 2 family protein [Gemmatimonadales bacterium]
MPNAGDVLQSFYQAVVQRDFKKARTFLRDDVVFVGLFETYPNADAYLTALTGLMQITVRLELKVVIAEGKNVAVFFELVTKEPAKATTLVAEWHQVDGGQIVHARSCFDGRPFAALFVGKP